MPEGSTCYCYGILTKEQFSKFDIHDLLFNQKIVRGFYLGKWILKKGIISLALMVRKVSKEILTTFKTTVSKNYKLDEINEAFEHYYSNMSGGKVILKPQQLPLIIN